ncbi:hypothetical protein NE237_026730 [Protea cynaroides]|uniref:Uncharacterized protein n=1 Tax=Protea cynaroides TaxID=273540 RepID=A0A9Q0GNV3_9MAGN|nr:hypothetical protein NE237_026730 [Protea cynaroides]
MAGPACSLEMRPVRMKIPAPMTAPRPNQRRSHHETIFESGFGFLESFEVIAPALKGFLCEEIVLAAPAASATINGSATSFSGNYHGQRKSEEPLAPPPSLSLGSSSGSMPTPFPGFSPSSIDDGVALLNSRRLPLWDPPSVRQRNGGTIFGFKAVMSRVHEGAKEDGLLFRHFSGRSELWFDFMADTGDGGNSTYTVARLLAQPEIHIPAEDSKPKRTLSRGDLLLIGGDLAFRLHIVYYRESMLPPPPLLSYETCSSLFLCYVAAPLFPSSRFWLSFHPTDMSSRKIREQLA